MRLADTSSLYDSLAEHLNSEISLGQLDTFSKVGAWIKSTYLWVRILKAPGHYKVKGPNTKEGIERFLSGANDIQRFFSF